LKDENNQVKEVIAAAIGGIGLPESQGCLDNLLNTLKPSKKQPQIDPQVKCMVIWAIGRIAS
jgi:hypothetical protein